MRHDLYRQQLERDKILIKDNCPKCHGDDTSCSCHQEFKSRNAFLKSNIPTKYQELSLDKLRGAGIKEAKLGVQEFISTLDDKLASGRGLYIYSEEKAGRVKPIGTSTLCYMVLMEAANRGIYVYATNIRDIANARNTDKEQTVDTRFSRDNIELCDLLLIDDIGTLNTMQTLHPYLKNSVLDVYSDRSKMKKSTIFASSLTPGQLTTVFGSHFEECLKRNTTFLEIT